MANLVMPDLSVPVVDPKTGLMTPPWRQFFTQLLVRLNAL